MTTLKSFAELSLLSQTGREPLPVQRTTVWALLMVRPDSEAKLHDFLVAELGIRRRFLRRQLHLTLYHARRPLPGLAPEEMPVDIQVPASRFRLMAMAPGGENPRPDVDMARVSIGLRVNRAASEADAIFRLRSRFYLHETPRVLGQRKPSHHRRSAFGARSYQPHINLIWGGSGLDPDLTKAGTLFRALGPLVAFDRLVVRVNRGA